MSDIQAQGPVKRVQIDALVIRADGTQVDLGRVADSSWLWNLVGRRFASRRIQRANRRGHVESED